MNTILYVDDDRDQLRRVHELVRKKYRILTADNGESALKLLGHHQVDLVISDLQMPKMDGTRFLQRVRLDHPDVLRVLACEDREKEDVALCLRQGIACGFLTKPWSGSSLLERLDRLFREQCPQDTPELRQMIGEAGELPTIEERYMNIVNLIYRDASISEIAAEIERDQSVAAQILHLMNTAYYGIRTTSIQRAINYIGLRQTLNLVLSVGIIQTLDGESNDVLVRLWDQAYLTNRLLVFLYEHHLGRPVPERAMPAGLLHRIGIIYFLRFRSEEYLSMIKRSWTDHKPLVEMEKETFGLSHPEAGSALLAHWGFSEEISEGARYTLEPFHPDVRHQELICALHVASKTADERHQIPHPDRFDKDVFTELGVTPERFYTSLGDFEAEAG